MDYITVIISALALSLSLFTFFRFDAKLKKQEKVLNDYRIKEYQDADYAKHYALLSINAYWRDKDSLYLIIENDGPSDAYNVTVKDLDKDSYLFRDLVTSFPIATIESGDSIQLELLVYSDMPKKTMLQVTWEDDSKEKHIDKVVLNIH